MAASLLVLAILLNARMAGNVTTSTELQFAELLTPEVRAELVIFGSSHASYGIHPGVLERAGVEVYNFAIAGSSPRYYLNWYENLFRRSPHRPSTILYAVDWFMFDENLWKRQFEDDSEYFPVELFLRLLVSPDTSRRTLIMNRYPLIKERFYFETIFVARTDYHDVAMEKFYHGYAPLEHRSSLAPRAIALHHDEHQVRALETLLSMIQEDGLDVVFVQVPEYLGGRSIQGESPTVVDEVVHRTRLPYLNYNGERVGEINSDPALFSDWGHLNEKGSHRFSELLLQDLAKEELLPPWRLRSGSKPLAQAHLP